MSRQLDSVLDVSLKVNSRFSICDLLSKGDGAKESYDRGSKYGLHSDGLPKVRLREILQYQA